MICQQFHSHKAQNIHLPYHFWAPRNSPISLLSLKVAQNLKKKWLKNLNASNITFESGEKTTHTHNPWATSAFYSRPTLSILNLFNKTNNNGLRVPDVYAPLGRSFFYHWWYSKCKANEINRNESDVKKRVVLFLNIIRLDRESILRNSQKPYVVWTIHKGVAPKWASI